MSTESPSHRDSLIQPSIPGSADGSMPNQADLNPYRAQPKTTAPSPAELGVEELTTAQCWGLVETSRLGRLAVDAYDGRPDVFPLNFLVHDRKVFVRSAPGTKLRSIAENPAVAFEVDGSDHGFHWSVVIRANAERLDTDADIQASGVLDLVSWSPTEKFDFVRLTPVTVTGRRFPRRFTDSPGRQRAAQAVVADDAASRHSASIPDPGQREDKPLPIPHFAPLPH